MWKENFALVGPEALGHGTPVVASDLGGVREWLRPGENGLAVRPGDAAALAGAVTSLLRDPERAARLGERGAELAREFGIDRHAEEMVSLYERILAEGNRTTSGGGRP